MVRISGVDVPDRKRAHIALTSIYGIGPRMAAEIIEKETRREVAAGVNQHKEGFLTDSGSVEESPF